jgi:hypothetical protein
MTPDTASRTSNLTHRRGLFVLLAAFGILIRLYLLATTYGTNDANFWSGWSSIVRSIGFVRAYYLTEMINHPPPALALALGIGALARRTGIPFIDLFRLVQVIADLVCAVAIYRIGLRQSVQTARALALFVLLSPAAAFVSGFHGNSDPLMIALVVVAAAFLGNGRWRAIAVGAMIALATTVKIVPLLFLPLFFFAVPRSTRAWFASAYSFVMAVSFLPAIIPGGPMVIRRIFGYQPTLPNEWGLTGLADGFSKAFPSLHDAARALFDFYHANGRFFVYAAVITTWIVLCRRPLDTPQKLLRACAIIVLIIFVFAPGFGVQYIAWLIPLLPFAFSWPQAIALNAAASVFLFITYTTWNGGWPWWYASVARLGPYRFVATLAGYAMWFAVCWALAVMLRRDNRTSPAPMAVTPIS